MKPEYTDITSRILEFPTWFDQNGTPRYGKFTPNQVPDIYANECALILIECQNCSCEFCVVLSMDRYTAYDSKIGNLSDHILKGAINYGDPPNINCCPAGPTMSSVNIRVIEFWKKDIYGGWERCPQFEIALPE